MELIAAMPAAAAGPLRNRVGMLHRGGFDALIPTVTSVKASITVNNVLTLPAYISPPTASRQAPMTCQLRSLVRSE